MINFDLNTKYTIDFSTKFKKQLRKIIRQNKEIDKLLVVVNKLANKEPLDTNYQDHQLINNKLYKNCRECHITPDWLLVYRCEETKLILLLLATDSHSELFDK